MKSRTGKFSCHLFALTVTSMWCGVFGLLWRVCGVVLETRRRAGGIRLVTQTINHGLPFSPVNYLFKIYLFHTINSICFQMLCYSRWVRHVCFGINGPITAPLSNGPWQRSGIAWSHLLLSFTFPYINWPITEGENVRSPVIAFVTNWGNAGLGTGERPASETGSTDDGLLVSSKNKHNPVMIYNDFND